MSHHCSNTTSMWRHTASFCPLCFLLPKCSSIACFILPYSIISTMRYTGDSVSASFEYHVPWRTNTIRRVKHHHSPRMHLQRLTPALNITSLPLSRLTSSYPMYHFIMSSSNRNTLLGVAGLLPHHISTLVLAYHHWMLASNRHAASFHCPPPSGYRLL